LLGNGAFGVRLARLTVLVALWTSSVLAAQYGLDERPSNPNCLAGDRPQVSTDVVLRRVFPNLQLWTLPQQAPVPQAINGPIELKQLPGDSSHWYSAERAGRLLRFVNDDAANSTTIVLDISERFIPTDFFGEWGITSFAFHPDFAANGEVYVVYNMKPSPDAHVVSRLSRFRSLDGGLSFDSASEEILLDFTQDAGATYHPFSHVAFGPDGFLYLGSGDGEAHAQAQDVYDLRGKMLRIDVNSGTPYAIPPTNPFAAGGGAPEVYAWGLRNPWRFSLDMVSGDLWLGDVGASAWEEVNLIEKGANYGWNVLEGNECLNAPTCDTSGLTPPVLAYSHEVGNAVTGGYVYRGTAIPDLQGSYVFADSANGLTIWVLKYAPDGSPVQEVLVDAGKFFSGFAQDNAGELYVFDVRARQVFILEQANAHTNGPANLLSQTGCVNPAAPTQPAAGLIPYDVITPLWSDGADKQRWMAIPDGTRIGVRPDGDFAFPIGTVLMKFFYHNGAPIETRLFMRHTDGNWAGYSYEWLDDHSDAVLLPAGKSELIGDFPWIYPSRPQCMQCHSEAAGFALGPEVVQLNKDFLYLQTGRVANQLRTLEHIGMFEQNLPATPNMLPALVALNTPGSSVVRQARSYLHANCSNCHRPGGDAQTPIDFRFPTPVEQMSVCNRAPHDGDVGVPGALLLVPDDPAHSIVSLRPKMLDANRMPPVASQVVDLAGTAAIDAWISHAGVCDVFPDTDLDGVRDDVDNCTTVANPDQRDTNGDGYGNACDADLSDDGVVNFQDLGMMQAVFFRQSVPDADLNGDGVVNFSDLAILKGSFFEPPGPSALVP
jgi:uncharacterized repeat protein (TIGR03806 family)